MLLGAISSFNYLYDKISHLYMSRLFQTSQDYETSAVMAYYDLCIVQMWDYNKLL